jgi:hypothetical protein
MAFDRVAARPALRATRPSAGAQHFGHSPVRIDGERQGDPVNALAWVQREVGRGPDKQAQRHSFTRVDVPTAQE